MADRNGYNKSLFETEDGVCYMCGYHGDTARHEILHGANRQNSKKYGLWINVCPRCHREIHANDNGEYIYLKEAAQALFETTLKLQGKTKKQAHSEYMAVFGRNYL